MQTNMSTIIDTIEKEIDQWLTTSRTITHAEKESNLRAALTRTYDQGKHDGMAKEAFNCHEHCEKARKDAIEEVIKKAEGMKAWKKCGLCDENIPGAECRCDGDEIGYNKALSDLIASLRGNK